MMELRTSETYQNLLKAYAGEREAAGKYLIYEIKARDDGYEQIGDIFHETAGNELEHAEIWLKWISGGAVPPTLVNLKDAAAGEHYEWTEMYKNFERTARREGFIELADLFHEVAEIEQSHDIRYTQLATNIETDNVFCKRCKVAWICMVCGHVTYAECAPDVCPVCHNPKAFAQVKCENYI